MQVKTVGWANFDVTDRCSGTATEERCQRDGSSTEPVTNEPAPVGDASSRGTSRMTSTNIAIVVALALVAGLIAWIVIDRSDSDSSSSTTPAATTPTTQGPAAIATPSDR